MITEKTHPNSRIITIFRAGSGLSRIQGKDMEDYFENTKQGIGSYWEADGSIKVGTGLEYNEQDLLLPYIVNHEAGDKGFRLVVESFYHEISTKVPHKLGVKLEIGLTVNNSQPVSLKNLPLNISDYVKWRHHRRHPKVAINKKEAEGNSLKEFYIFDPEEVQISKTKKLKIQDEAMQIYLTVKKQPEKIDWILTLLGIDPRSIYASNKSELNDLKLEKLKDLSDKRPEEFLQVNGADHLEVMYTIEKMANLKVLTKVGTKYINTETKMTIGHNMEEAIAYFIDDANEQYILMLKAHMQEAERKPYNAGVKTTMLTDKQRYGGIPKG